MDFRAVEMQFDGKEMKGEIQEINIGRRAMGFKKEEITYAREEMKIDGKVLHIVVRETKCNGIATRPNNTATKNSALFFLLFVLVSVT